MDSWRVRVLVRLVWNYLIDLASFWQSLNTFIVYICWSFRLPGAKIVWSCHLRGLVMMLNIVSFIYNIWSHISKLSPWWTLLSILFCKLLFKWWSAIDFRFLVIFLRISKASLLTFWRLKLPIFLRNVLFIVNFLLDILLQQITIAVLNIWVFVCGLCSLWYLTKYVWLTSICRLGSVKRWCFVMWKVCRLFLGEHVIELLCILLCWLSWLYKVCGIIYCFFYVWCLLEYSKLFKFVNVVSFIGTLLKNSFILHGEDLCVVLLLSENNGFFLKQRIHSSNFKFQTLYFGLLLSYCDELFFKLLLKDFFSIRSKGCLLFDVCIKYIDVVFLFFIHLFRTFQQLFKLSNLSLKSMICNATFTCLTVLI